MASPLHPLLVSINFSVLHVIGKLFNNEPQIFLISVNFSREDEEIDGMNVTVHIILFSILSTLPEIQKVNLN